MPSNSSARGWSVGGAAVIQVLHHLVDIAEFGEVVEQLRQADPGGGVAGGDFFQQGLGGFFVRLAERRVAQHTGHAVDALGRDRATAVAGFQLLEQLGLFFRRGLFLVDRGQLDVADVGGVQGGLADAFHIIQMLVVGVLGAIQQHLGQARFRVTRRLPFADLLLGVHVRKAVRVLQVQHRQRNQGIAFAIGKGFFQQALGFVLLGLGGARLGHQQATQAGLGARRGIGGRAVGGLGLADLLGVAGGHLDIRQADLSLAVTQVCQLLIVLLGGDRVATFEGFVGQALVGQAGATGEADRQCQCAECRGEVRPALCGSWLACDAGNSVFQVHRVDPIAGKPDSHSALCCA